MNFAPSCKNRMFDSDNISVFWMILVTLNRSRWDVQNVTKIIGTEEIEGSLTQEISQLKSQRNNKVLQTNSLVSEEDDKIKRIEVTEDLSLIKRQFPDFAYKAIKEDLKVNRKSGFVNTVINNFQLIFVKRSLTPQEGNTVDSILSRA